MRPQKFFAPLIETAEDNKKTGTPSGAPVFYLGLFCIRRFLLSMQGQAADVDRAHDRFIAFVVYNTELEHIVFDRARRICRKREIEISQRCTFARKSRRAVTDFRIFPKRLLFKPKCI